MPPGAEGGRNRRAEKSEKSAEKAARAIVDKTAAARAAAEKAKAARTGKGTNGGGEAKNRPDAETLPATTGAREEALPLSPHPWKPIWQAPVRVGYVGGKLDVQIAVRGPLIVVPAEKDPAAKDDSAEGVYVVDGRGGKLVRHFRYPGEGGPSGAVSLDGDFFLLSSANGVVRKVRLDGLVSWAAQVGAERPLLPTLVDLNRDGVRDVIVPFRSKDAPYRAIALDGRDGALMWRSDQSAEERAMDCRWGIIVYARDISYVRLPRLVCGKAQRLVQPLTGEESALSLLSPEEPDAPADTSHFKVYGPHGAQRLPPSSLTWDSRNLIQETGWKEIAFPFSEPITAPPSLGVLTEMPRWDVVVATGAWLYAIATDLSALESQPLPHGDLAATGANPYKRQDPADYRARLPMADARWLASGAKAFDSSFEQLPDGNTAPDAPIARAEDLRKDPLHGAPSDRIALHGSLRAAIVEGQPVLCNRTTAGCLTLALPNGRATHVAFDDAGTELWALTETGTFFRRHLDRPGTPAGEWVRIPDPGAVDASRAGPVLALVVAADVVAVAQGQQLAMYPIHQRHLLLPALAPLRAEQLVHCEDGWFANNDGKLARPVGGDLSKWVVVADHPGPVRSLACDSGRLVVVDADGKGYRLVAPATPYRTLWIFAGLMIVVLLVTALAPVRARVQRPLQDVHQQFRSDVPFRSRKVADEHQLRLVDALMAFLDNVDTHPPVTLAISGAWGSGKSSIMGLLRDQMAATGRYVHVWFNAWRFQREPQIANAFYQTILDEFRRQVGWMERLRVFAKRLVTIRARDVVRIGLPCLLILATLGVLTLLLLGALQQYKSAGLTSTITVVGATLALFVPLWRRVLSPLIKIIDLEPAKLLDQLRSRVRLVHDLKSQLESVFSALGDTARLLVFVDDLDRCPPDRVADMLEALNMLADTRQALMVVAIDPVAVERSVEVRFKDLLTHMREQNPEEARNFGARYVEKLVTISVNVPPVQAKQVHKHDQPTPSDETTEQRLSAFDRVLHVLPLVLTLVAMTALLYPIGLALKNMGKPSEIGRRLYESVTELIGTATQEPAAAKASAAAEPQTQPAALPPKPENTPGPAPEPKPAAPKPKPVADRPPSAPEKTDAPAPSLEPLPARPPVMAALPDGAPLATERRRAQRWKRIADGAALAIILAGAAISASFVARRRRLRASKQPTSDSEAFKYALEQASGSLEPNPRNAIRFTNHARFLYHLVKQPTPTAPPLPPSWEPAFFTLLLQQWNKQPVPAPVSLDTLDPDGRVRTQLREWLPQAKDTPPILDPRP
jgi:hypothetical protein